MMPLVRRSEIGEILSLNVAFVQLETFWQKIVKNEWLILARIDGFTEEPA